MIMMVQDHMYLKCACVDDLIAQFFIPWIPQEILCCTRKFYDVHGNFMNGRL